MVWRSSDLYWWSRADDSGEIMPTSFWVSLLVLGISVYAAISAILLGVARRYKWWKEFDQELFAYLWFAIIPMLGVTYALYNIISLIGYPFSRLTNYVHHYEKRPKREVPESTPSELPKAIVRQ